MTLTLMGAGPEAAGGAAFTPASLPGLMAWYDLSLQAGTDGSAISSVTDQSGNGRTLTQATGSLQPLLKAGANGINSLNVALLDGVDDFLATAAFASPTAGVSVFAVHQFANVTGFQTIALHAAAATWVSPFARWAIRLNSNGKIQAWVQDGGVAGNNLDSTTLASTAAAARGFTYNGTALTHYLNGTADGTSSPGVAMTSSTQPIYVGSHTGGGGEPLSGKLGELVVCDNAISGANITSLSGYFRSKWGTP